MADEDQRPSLEPPKLFGRRRKDGDGDPEPESVRAPLPDDFTARDEPFETARTSPPQEPPPVARTLVTGAPLFVEEAPEPEPLPEPATEPEPEPGSEPAKDTAPGARRAKSRRVPRGPVITGYPASALTGLLVGLLMVGLTVASLRACEGIRGTSTCGGPGLLILVIILVVLVMVGQLLLKLLRVPDPGSTSFLAVGLIAVVALLFLIDVILDWQMIIVIPIVGMAAFLLSHWVTTAFVEPADR